MSFQTPSEPVTRGAKTHMQFYYADGDQQKGPVDIDRLRTAGIKADTLVWRDGMSEWLPAARVPELAPLFAAPVPAAPSPPSPYAAPVAAEVHPQPFVAPPTPMQTGYTPNPDYAPNLNYGGYGASQYGGMYTPPPSQGMSIASLVLGILAIPSTFCYGAGFLFAILAIIFGHIGHSQHKKQTGQASGMAIAGLICGYISLAIVALVFLFFMMLMGAMAAA